MKKNKKLQYEIDTKNFKKQLKADLLESLNEETAETHSSAFLPKLLPKLSVVATLLIVVVLSSQIFPKTPDAYAFLKEAQQKYEQEKANADLVKTRTEYTEAGTTYVLNVEEDTKKDTVKIKIEDKTNNKAVGEVFIKDKKLYTQKALKNEIKTGLKDSKNASPLADVLSKKLTVKTLFFEDALAQKDLKYEGEVQKDDKQLIKLSHGKTELFFEAETLKPYEFLDEDDEEENYPEAFKILEEIYENFDDEDHEDEEDEDEEDDFDDYWEEIRFEDDDDFMPHPDDLEDLIYELEIYEDLLEKIDPNNKEEVKNLIHSLEKTLEKAGNHKAKIEPSFNDMKKHILEFLDYAEKKGENVTAIKVKVQNAKTEEDLEKIGEEVPKSLHKLYEESDFNRFDEDEEDYKELKKITDEELKRIEEMHYKNEDNEDHEDHEDDNHDEEDELDYRKEVLMDIFDNGKDKGFNTDPYYNLIEDADSLDELEDNMEKLPKELHILFTDLPIDNQHDKHDEDKHSDYYPQHPYDIEDKDDHTDADDEDNDHDFEPQSYEPDKPYYDDFNHDDHSDHDNFDDHQDPDHHYNDEDDHHDEDFQDEADEYEDKVNEVLDTLAEFEGSEDEEDAYYDDLKNARSHEDLDEILNDLSE